MEKLSESSTAFEKFKDALKEGGDRRTEEMEQLTKTHVPSPSADLESQLKSAISRFQMAKEYNKSQKMEHKAKEKELRETLEERDLTIEYLTKQLAHKGCKTCKNLVESDEKLSFSARSKSQETEAAKTNNYIRSLESEVQNLKKTLKENEEYYENSVSNYSKQIHETVGYMHQLRLDYEGSGHMLWKTIEEQKKKIEAMVTEHQKALNVIGKQELQLEDLRKIRDSVEDAELQKLQKDSEYLNFDVALLTRQVEELKQDNRTAQKEIIELSAKLLCKDQKLEHLHDKTRQLDTAQKEIDELSNKLLNTEINMEDYAHEIRTLQEEIREHKAQEEFLNESIQRMEAEHAEAMQELQVIIDKQDDDLEKYRMEEEKEANAVENYFAGLKIDEEGEEEEEERKSVDSDGWKKLDESDDSDGDFDVDAYYAST